MQFEDIDDEGSTRRAYLSALGVAGVGGRITRDTQTTTRDQELASVEIWPHPRYDVSGTGFAPQNAAPDSPPTEKWRFVADDEISGDLTSPVVVGDGLVYARTVEYHDSRTSVFAVDAETGELVWKDSSKTENARWVSFPSPVLSDNRLVVGYEGGYAVAFDARTGEQLWTYETNDASSDVVTPWPYSGTIFLSSSERIYALNAETGAKQWTWGPGRPYTNITSVSVGEESLYVGTEYDGLYVVDVESGKRINRHDLSNSLYPSSIVDGTVYSIDGNILRLINLEEMSVRWMFRNEKLSAGETVPLTRPTVTDDAVIVGEQDTDSRVWAFDRSTGAKRWTFQTSKSINDPVVVGNTVLISCFAGGDLDMDALYALDVQDGSVQWRAGIEGLFGVEYHPIVADGTIYLSFDHLIISLMAGDDPWPSLQDIGLGVSLIGALGAGGLLANRARSSSE
jgi:outer membrane protein assembly factor BamB